MPPPFLPDVTWLGASQSGAAHGLVRGCWVCPCHSSPHGLGLCSSTKEPSAPMQWGGRASASSLPGSLAGSVLCPSGAVPVVQVLDSCRCPQPGAPRLSPYAGWGLWPQSCWAGREHSRHRESSGRGWGMPCVKVGCSVELAQCFLKLLSHQSSPGHPALAKRRWAPPSRRGESGPGGPLAQVSTPPASMILSSHPRFELRGDWLWCGPRRLWSATTNPLSGSRPPAVDAAYEREPAPRGPRIRSLYLRAVSRAPVVGAAVLQLLLLMAFMALGCPVLFLCVGRPLGVPPRERELPNCSGQFAAPEGDWSVPAGRLLPPPEPSRKVSPRAAAPGCEP